MRRTVDTAVAAALLCVACSGGTGRLDVAISGEEAATSGYPVAPGTPGEIGFADGWTLEIDQIVVSLSQFELRGAGGADAALESDAILAALHGGDASAWTFPGVPARRWEDVRYRIAPPDPGARDVGPVDPSTRAQMIASGWSIYLEARAAKGGVTRTLRWGIPLEVDSRRCVSEDGTDGTIVAANERSEAQVTIHLDHLFFDDLRLDEAQMRFDAIAAAADPSGVVSFDALSVQRLADLRGLDGMPLVDDQGAPVLYDPGSAALSEPTLRAMVLEAASTIGHWNGEGHCEYVVAR